MNCFYDIMKKISNPSKYCKKMLQKIDLLRNFWLSFIRPRRFILIMSRQQRKIAEIEFNRKIIAKWSDFENVIPDSSLRFLPKKE